MHAGTIDCAAGHATRSRPFPDTPGLHGLRPCSAGTFVSNSWTGQLWSIAEAHLSRDVPNFRTFGEKEVLKRGEPYSVSLVTCR